MKLPVALSLPLLLAGSSFAVVSQVIDYDFDIRDGTAGIFQNTGGSDHVMTTVNTTGGVIASGAGGERIEWLGNSTTLSMPTAPYLTGVNMTVGGSARPEIGNVSGGGMGMPGAGVTNQLDSTETMTFTFDRAIAITEIDLAWWDNGGATPDLAAITIGGTTYNTNVGNRNSALDFTTGVGGAFPATTISDPVSGNSVTGVVLQAGSPITFSLWDTDGNGALEGNGLVQGIMFAVIPEPSRASLLGIGAIFLLWRRRRG